MIMPVDEMGHFYPEFGWLAGRATSEATDDILADLSARDRLVAAGTIEHRFPECWRCHTPLIFRISDDWFISVTDIREPMREANAGVEWTPAYMGKRMDDWLVNMGDWNISRRRYYGLPLPFYPCSSCGHLTVIGSRQELAERATGPLDGLQELRRPWIDDIAIACAGCGHEVHRIQEVGDVWLDAGIVPFSTLGWENPTWIEGGYGDGAAAGLTGADLPDHAYWEEWFPADWVSEMREQIRLWFYSQLFMSVALTGRAPYRKVLGYEKMLDETGREMHGSWGNQISASEAFERMGADVMRWQFCQQPPSPGPAVRVQARLRDPAQGADAVEQRGVLHPVRRPRRVHAVVRRPRRRGHERAPDGRVGPRPDRPLRRHRHRGLRELPHGQRPAGVRAVRRRPVELVHPPFPPAVLERRRRRAAHAVGVARPEPARRVAGAAVPDRAPLAAPRRRRVPRCAALGVPGRLADGGAGRRPPPRRRRRDAQGDRARPPGPLGRQAAVAPAARHARRRRRRRGGPARPAHGRDRRGAARQARSSSSRSRRRRSRSART